MRYGKEQRKRNNKGRKKCLHVNCLKHTTGYSDIQESALKMLMRNEMHLMCLQCIEDMHNSKRLINNTQTRV